MFLEKKMASAGGASNYAKPALAKNIRFSFLVLAFVGMAIGLVGSCNNGASGAYAASGMAPPGLTEESAVSGWKVRAYSRAIVNNPGRLLKLTGREVTYALNLPSLERYDRPTVVWQYTDGEHCVLDIYFLAGNAAKAVDTKVEHFELRAPDGAEVDRAYCLHRLTAKAQVHKEEVSLAQAG
jgi:hypothetical protein